MKNIMLLFLAALLVTISAISGAQNRYQFFQPANGILKGSTTTYVTQSATAADLIGLLTGTCSPSVFVEGDGACAKVDLTSQVTGILPLGSGGIGATSLSAATIPVFSGSIITGDCVKWLSATSIGDAGSACGSGGGGGGSVNSVALFDGSTVPIYSISNSPVTNTGTLTFTLTNESPNFGLFGPASGVSSAQPTFRAIVSKDMPAANLASALNGGVTGLLPNANLANSSFTLNGSSVSLGGIRTLSLASGDFAAQGTTTTVLHGNAAGNPSFGGVNLSTDIIGNLSTSNLASGTNASTLTFWNGSGAWTVPNIFNGGVISSVASPEVNLGISANHAVSRWVDTNGPTNGKAWQLATAGANGTLFCFDTVSDDFVTTYSPALCITRSVSAVADVSLGNTTDNPTYHFNGSGAATFSGPLNASSSTGVALTVNGVASNTALVVNPNASSTGIAVVAAASNAATIVVRGNGNAGSAAGSFNQDSVSVVHVSNNGAAALDFDTNGSNRTSINQNGDMVLNAPTSGTVLTVNSFDNNPATFNGANSATGSALQVTGAFTGAGNTNLLQISDTNNTNGANLSLIGNGATTPRKTMRVTGGNLQILNSGYTSSLFSLNDNGNLTLPSNGANQIVFASAPSSFTSQIFVGGNGATQSASMLMEQDTSHNGYIRNQDTGSLFLGVGSTNYWSVTPSGGLTNGTVPASGAALILKSLATSPALTVDSSSFGWTTHGAIDFGISGGLQSDSVTSNTNLTNNLYFSNPNWTYKNTGAASYIRQDSSGTIQFYTAPSGTAATSASLTNDMEIYNDGGVTIGTPTGGDKGPGTFNASSLFVGGVAVGTGSGSVSSITAGTGLTGGTITTSGTIALATPVSVLNGGDGLSTATLGDIRYASATNTLAALAGNTTATKKFLNQTGTGSVSAAPSWGTIASGDVSGLSASATTDTTNASNITSGSLAAARMPALTGDCTTTSGAVATTCTKTSGVAFATSATTDATNATNISAGTLAAARLATSGVTAGSYTNSNITVDSAGRVTAASNGSGGGSKIAHGVFTIGSGSCTIAFSGAGIGSCGFNSTGNVTVTFTSSYYSTGATCIADVVNGVFAVASTQGTGIIGNVNVLMDSSAGVPVNGSFNMICTGT